MNITDNKDLYNDQSSLQHSDRIKSCSNIRIRLTAEEHRKLTQTLSANGMIPNFPDEDESLQGTELSKAEREYILNEFWYNEEVINDMIREAVSDSRQKSLVDFMVYLWACEAAHAMEGKFKRAAHGGNEEADVASTMFLSYLQMDFSKVASLKNPKQYICRVLTNRRQRMYSEETSFLSVIDKTSSRFRRLYLEMMADEERPLPQNISPKYARLLDRLRENDSQGIRLDAPSMIQHPGRGSIDYCEPISELVVDENSEDGYKMFLSEETQNEFLLTFIPDPLVRELFRYLYFMPSEGNISPDERTANAYKYLNNRYGIDQDDFRLCKYELRHFVKKNKNNIRDFILCSYSG